MRTIRLFLSLLSSLIFVTFVLFLSISSDPDPRLHDDQPQESRRSLGSYFYLHNPASLFTPAATISLTDDNSTAFAAWPAAFGPLLPLDGLSGQLWVGSGFGFDNLGRSGIAAGVEGELGCGDIPGWSGHDWRARLAQSYSRGGDQTTRSNVQHAEAKIGSSKRDLSPCTEDEQSPHGQEPPADNDGTDDHLQFPLPRTNIFRRSGGESSQGRNSPLEHSDIQSLQESAEIAGKVVILSRGGCGFSEKVKWAQRRGATAVIIGDNILGGPLVRMYSRGDTDNITIPSLFTSHTTAHLLSSLIPTGHKQFGSASASLWKWPSSSTLHAHGSKSDIDKDQARKQASHTSTTIDASIGKPTSQAQTMRKSATASDTEVKTISVPNRGWIESFLSAFDLAEDSSRGARGRDSRRPPSSGQLLWSKPDLHIEELGNTKQGSKSAARPASGFIIGIQDWRDPDVTRVGTEYEQTSTTPTASMASMPTTGLQSANGHLKGGSITPGSGEYEQLKSSSRSAHGLSDDQSLANDEVIDAEGWLGHLQWSGQEDEEPNGVLPSAKASLTTAIDKQAHQLTTDSHRGGLWVTLTPTDMESNPFFNTLFVLVVSPLFTLAIVYSMLLLRSRIRRRRWRAPKSVVERLPVHVYHTATVRSSSSSTHGASSPTSSTATTPLLSESRLTEITCRPRSRTVPAPPSIPSSSRYGSLEPSSMEQEKVNAALAEWKRKYKGKQVECVVCLEEYVDGVSKVMSLPCGHEFHADCITPWLTTRRRTCPICKGDVVRSMGRSSPSKRPHTTHEMTEDDVQERAAGTINPSPLSALPVPVGDEVEDLERAEHSFMLEEGTSASTWVSRNVNRGLEFIGVQRHENHDH